MSKPLRVGATVRLIDRPQIAGMLIWISDGAAVIRQPDGTRYADLPENVMHIEAERKTA